MPYQKVASGDKWEPKAAFHNALVELVNKRDLEKNPQTLPNDIYWDGCINAMTADSGLAIIPPFRFVVKADSISYPPVTADPDGYCLKNKPYIEVRELTAPYTYPTYYENTSPFIGITQEPLRPGSYPGKVRVLGSTWVYLPAGDLLTDLTTYGQTHINFVPGQGLRGAYRGPIRVMEVVELDTKKYAKVLMCDYTVTSVVAISHATTGIPAMEGTTPGSAACELVWLNPQTKAWTPLGVYRQIYNIAQTPVEPAVVIQAKVESYSGLFVVDFEECPVPAS